MVPELFFRAIQFNNSICETIYLNGIWQMILVLSSKITIFLFGIKSYAIQEQNMICNPLFTEIYILVNR